MSNPTAAARPIDFAAAFQTLTGNAPFPWQWELFRLFCAGLFPPSCNLPTGVGKTSVIPVWLFALAVDPTVVPRRLVYVVNRRTVVDQSTQEAERLRERLASVPALKAGLQALCAVPTDTPLAISTLRGQFADNGEWRNDPARPAIVVGTVDMVGSRLLFNGYGTGFRTKPLHAGFLGQDVLLVHDEAHLEPAFQDLLVAIEREQQRCKELRSFRVMELSATSRGQAKPFELTDAERHPPSEIPDPPIEPTHVVWRRLKAHKSLHLVPVDDEKKELADKMVDLALTDRFKLSGQAIMIFVRSVENVEKIVSKLHKQKQNVQQLTGTLRGLERDRMADPRRVDGCPIFARFLKQPKPDAPEDERWRIDPTPGTVYLVCTSAGEVGVNISADHLVCDLSTFDSMAQRFGRVNRFGDRDDTEIHVVHPVEFDGENALERRRALTLRLLGRLHGNASPAALDALGSRRKRLAFAPTPVTLPTSDILFDAWALTTIRGRLPGRPPVEPYLHGLSEWQPPETHIAWREEVSLVAGPLREEYMPQDLLDDYPLKPHELLRDVSSRVYERLKKLAAPKETTVWIVSEDDSVAVTSLGELVESGKDAISYKTVLLAPQAGGLAVGMLRPDSTAANDVADEWYEGTDKKCLRRVRVWEDDENFDEKTSGMRLIRRLEFSRDQDDVEAEGRTWLWFERPGQADDEGSRSAKKPIRWHEHTDDVTKNAALIVQALGLPIELQTAVKLAAKFHDLGKKRELWQRSIGNPSPKSWLAKSGRDESGKLMKPIDLTDYRHEFGSLLDLQEEREFQALTGDSQELVLHLIAAHHGRARPHFPVDEAFDPEPNGKDVSAIAAKVPQRFARLQRRFGRWGLAYLESLLRAADYAASANPSEFLEDVK